MSTASRLPHRRSRALLLHSVVRCSCTLSSASAPIGVAQGRCHGARGAVCGCGCSCLPRAGAGAGAGARTQVRVVHRGLSAATGRLGRGRHTFASSSLPTGSSASLSCSPTGTPVPSCSIVPTVAPTFCACRGRMTSRANHRRARRSPSHRAHCAAQRSARP